MKNRKRYIYIVATEWKDVEGGSSIVASFSNPKLAIRYAKTYILDEEEYLYIIKMTINDPSDDGTCIYHRSL